MVINKKEHQRHLTLFKGKEIKVQHEGKSHTKLSVCHYGQTKHPWNWSTHIHAHTYKLNKEGLVYTNVS